MVSHRCAYDDALSSCRKRLIPLYKHHIENDLRRHGASDGARGRIPLRISRHTAHEDGHFRSTKMPSALQPSLTDLVRLNSLKQLFTVMSDVWKLFSLLDRPNKLLNSFKSWVSQSQRVASVERQQPGPLGAWILRKLTS